tara:strand:+ start:323 stop:760 length:438 start_codon:yes stop_codon:yes gene_type:complete
MQKTKRKDSLSMTSPLVVASFLSEFRQRNRAVPVHAIEALLLIASGIDNMNDLRKAMSDEEGEALPVGSMSRLVSLLRGRARWNKGKWIESPFEALIEVRSHPHQRGMQLLLSEMGETLVFEHLNVKKNTLHMGGEHINLFEENS